MNKLFLPLILGIFLLTFISASPLQEFLSDDVTGMEITITPNTTEVEFYLNTSGTSFDIQDIKFEDFEVKNIPLSTIMNEINFNIEYIEGENYPEFTYFNIEEASLTSVLVDNIFTYFDYDFLTEDLNNNISIINNLIKQNVPAFEIIGDASLEKDSINYYIEYSKGIGDIPEEYHNKIREIINQSVYLFNLKELLNEPIFAELDLQFLDDLDYTAEIKWEGIAFENGNYEMEVTFSTSEEVVSKIIKVNLSGVLESEEPEEEEEEEEEENNNNGGGSGGGSSYNDDEEEEPEKIIDACKEGETICSRGSVYVCNDGYWKVKENCEYGCGDGECIERPIVIGDEKPKESFLYILLIALFTAGILALVVVLLVVNARKKEVENQGDPDENSN